MARFKDFDAAEAEREGEPITFRLGGRDWTAANVNAVQFLKLTRQVAEGGTAVVIGYDDYLMGVLPEKDREPFRTMLEAKNISLPALMEVVNWVVAEATGNPTTAASSSPVAPSGRGRRPRVVSLSQTSTPIPVGTASVAG